MADVPALTVRVPATSANLGPGFDCLGLAVDLWNEFTFAPAEGRIGTDLPVRSYQHACAELGVEPLPLAATGGGVVPRTRGLGSSSTCVVAGVLAAGALHGIGLSSEDAVRIATAIEGHPDNVAPAILGGVVASAVTHDGRVLSLPVPLPRDLPLLALIPDHELSTEAARGALPESLTRDDAVFTASRAALLVAALATGRDDALAEAFQDRLHTPHRAPLVPGLASMMEVAVESGALGAYLSGAGPTVMVVGPGPETAAALNTHLAGHPWSWDLRPMAVTTRGAHVASQGGRSPASARPRDTCCSSGTAACPPPQPLGWTHGYR